MSKIAVITPSKGRKTLLNVIRHTAGLLQDGDMHCVGLDTLADGYDVATLSNLPKLPFLHAEEMPVLRSVFGNGQRDLLLQHATEMGFDWAVFCDDDDSIDPIGLEAVRALDPSQPFHLFRVSSPLGNGRGHIHKFEFRYVCGAMCVIRPTKGMPQWMSSGGYTADCFTTLKYGEFFGPPVWHDQTLIREQSAVNL